jgi:hypothetical protein
MDGKTTQCRYLGAEGTQGEKVKFAVLSSSARKLKALPRLQKKNR